MPSYDTVFLISYLLSSHSFYSNIPSFVSGPYWKKPGALVLSSVCQGRSRRREIKAGSLTFHSVRVLVMMSFFDISLFKYWSVEGSVTYLWLSTILDRIKQRGGNRVTKTSCLSCLENKSLLGLKVKTQVKTKKKKILTHLSLSHLW